MGVVGAEVFGAVGFVHEGVDGAGVSELSGGAVDFGEEPRAEAGVGAAGADGEGFDDEGVDRGGRWGLLEAGLCIRIRTA